MELYELICKLFCAVIKLLM